MLLGKTLNATFPDFSGGVVAQWVVSSDGFSVRGGLERNLKGGCGEAFCGGCFVVFFEGAALQHLSSGGAALTFFVGAT